MSALVLGNVQENLRCVVFNPSSEPRAVAKLNDDGISEQCIIDGDVIVYKKNNCSEINIMLSNVSEWSSGIKMENLRKTCVTPEVLKFLRGNDLTVPSGLGWNGEDTINDLAFRYGLDLLLIGCADNAVLGGLMGLSNNFDVPMVGNFNVDELFHNVEVDIKHDASDRQVDNLFKTVPLDYLAKLNEGGVVVPADAVNWNHAKALSNVMSVSCILINGVPERYNDLLIWRKGVDKPELVTLMDTVYAFKMADTNFISLPYVIDEDVTRVMYILHHNALTESGNNAIRLYRKR